MFKINLKLWKKTAILILMPLTFYGCDSSYPEASDEQLISFFAHNGFGFSSGFSDEPKVIPKSMVECLATLSGASFDDFEAPPKEMADMMRVGCQSMLLKLVNDKNINVIGFKMKNFESKDLTKRVYKLYETSYAAYEQYRIEQNKKREEQENERKLREIEKEKLFKQEKETELKKEQDQYAAFVSSLDSRLIQLRATCDEYEALVGEVNKVDGNKAALFRLRRDTICNSDFSQLKSQANDLLTKWNNVKVEGSGQSFYFIAPYISTLADDKRINYAMEKLNKGIADMKNILGQ